ncbi:MAG TPA: choice-of-anchor tandem repeat GloVer-containing protein [Crinalium sp.]
MKNFKLLLSLPCSLAIASLMSLPACEAIHRIAPANSPVETTQASIATQVTLTTIAHFNGSNGSDPIGVVQGKDGNFYGVTASGGNPGAGTVFRLTPEGHLATLVNFNAQINGYNPETPLTVGQDGNLYGTTTGGGETGGGGFGTVFRVTPEGQFTTLVVFDRTNGARPERPLIQAKDGNFYGTTYMGGTKQQGTLFRLTPSGQLTTLVQFDIDFGEASPVKDHPGGLDIFEDQNGNLYVTHGNFYGTEYMADGAAKIFRLTGDSKLVPLTTFQGLNQGATREAYPSQLIQGSDGNFYGVTLMGTFFRLTPDGQRTAIATFDRDLFPNSLIQGHDGNFYGTAIGREETIPGAVFRITPQGQITLLVRFTGENGRYPRSLMQASDGTFYGTTGQGGQGDPERISSAARGTVFRLTVN